MHLYVANARTWRAFLEPRGKRVKLRRRAFGEDFHRPVRTVFDPSGNPLTARLTLRIVTKADALDVPADCGLKCGV